MTLKELPRKASEPRRKWYTAPGMDVIVWFDAAEQIRGYQLCYEKELQEFALTWKRGKGFDHAAIDSGEQLPMRNRSPILVIDGNFDAAYVDALFDQASSNVPAAVRNLVAESL